MDTRPRHIAVIGAGSIAHGRRLLDDLFTVGPLANCTITLMAPSLEHLSVVERYARRVVKHNGLGIEIMSTTDRTEALKDADYVIGLFDVGGFRAFDVDFEIVRGYGLDVCIGDTSGPTGVMKALRNGAVLKELADDMRRLCPRALYIPYANPMAVLVMAADAFGVSRVVGLCRGTQATRRTIAACIGAETEEVTVTFAGINHMCWALAIQMDGRDAYPLFRERLSRPEFLTGERVRFEVMQHFGYFPTETSGHLSDFFPWFRRDERTRQRYCSVGGYSGASGAFHKYSSFLDRHYAREDYLQFEDGALSPRSDDYCAPLIEAIESDTEYRFVGNVMNRGHSIENLPESACVEIPVVADGAGVHAEAVGSLPPQLAALCKTNLISQELTLEAIKSFDPEFVFAAIAVDPLTSSVLDLPQIRQLTVDLLKANERFLPAGILGRLRKTTEILNSYPVRAAVRPHEDLMDALSAFRAQRPLHPRGHDEPSPG